MPNIIVQKFGGTSVGSEERIASVAKIVQKASLENSYCSCSISNER